ncbi:RDD family protein [Bacillus sp. M6-12]|uniref:RDD family protein n=1 Tax=Bacillus sp. M6-12 TaxID=2054166 RepID=UPI0015E07059|nr:RDD family protein [Bacillus sp. M6-12]
MENKYGGFWIRVVASVIDFLVLFIPLFGVDYLIYRLIGPDVPYLDYILDDQYVDMWTSYDTVSLIVITLIGILYYGLLTSKLGGTLGKLALGLRVVGKNGQFISVGRAIGRYFAYIPSSILNIGFIMVALTVEKQGLHDLICKTYVVKK